MWVHCWTNWTCVLIALHEGYMSKGRYRQAYNSLARLRRHPIQATRDLYCKSSIRFIWTADHHYSEDIHVLLEAEKDVSHGRNRFLELFTVPRNRRATQGSLIVMFMWETVNPSSRTSDTDLHLGNNSVESTLLPITLATSSLKPISRKSKHFWPALALYVVNACYSNDYSDLLLKGMINWIFAFPAIWYDEPPPRYWKKLTLHLQDHWYFWEVSYEPIRRFLF